MRLVDVDISSLPPYFSGNIARDAKFVQRAIGPAIRAAKSEDSRTTTSPHKVSTVPVYLKPIQ